MSDFEKCLLLLVLMLLMAYYCAVIVVCVTFGYWIGVVISSLITIGIAVTFIKVFISLFYQNNKL